MGRIERQLSRMLICLRICSKMLSISQPKLSRNSTLRRISPLSSRKSSTKSTTPPGIVSWVETSVPTSPTRPSTSSTSISVKSHPPLQEWLSTQAVIARNEYSYSPRALVILLTRSLLRPPHFFHLSECMRLEGTLVGRDLPCTCCHPTYQLQ